jgi:predicted Rossmann-fold nucleotide-binding protein
VLVGVSFWSGLKEWIKEVMLEKENNVNPDDLDLIPITDDIEEVVRIINDFYSLEKDNKLEPNYDM